RLPEEIRTECRTSDIPKSVLFEIAREGSRDHQARLWALAREGQLTVQRVRRARTASPAVSATDPAKGGRAARSVRREIRTEQATVTVLFRHGSGSLGEVVCALRAALRQCRQIVAGTGGPARPTGTTDGTKDR